MKQAAWLWYLLAAVVALAPAGLRALTWPRHRPQPVDADMALAGQELFQHVWKEQGDPFLGSGDGLGPVYNATSCVACHNQSGIGGSGGLEHNVTTFTVRPTKDGGTAREGVLHASARKGFEETLDLIAPGLPHMSHIPLEQLVRVTRSGHCVQGTRFPAGVHVSQRNTPALFGARLIDEIPQNAILANAKRQRLSWGGAPADSEDVPVGRAMILANGKVGRFGWKAQAPSLSAFVQAACANELGLGNPGQAQPTPLGRSDYQPPGLDLTQEQCDQLTSFCASLSRPVERVPAEPPAADQALAGKQLFRTIGCADCHTPDLGGVEGLYSDLLLHRMGQDLEGGGSYNDPPLPPPNPSPAELPLASDGPSPGEWRTPPLWGVADSAPYLHDGRAPTLADAIRLHGGQAARSARRFAALGEKEQAQLVAFLKTLRAP
jgi:CxxC motif-containing protein (DUF1111 family)